MEDFVENQRFQLWKGLKMVVEGLEKGSSTKSVSGNEFITNKLHFLSAEYLKSPIFEKLAQMTVVIKKRQ